MVCRNCILSQNLRTKWSKLFLLDSLSQMICKNSNLECNYYIIATTLIFTERPLPMPGNFDYLQEKFLWHASIQNKNVSRHSYPFKNCISYSVFISQTGLKTQKDILVSRGRQLQLLRDWRFTRFCSTISKTILCLKIHRIGLGLLLLLFHFAFFAGITLLGCPSLHLVQSHGISIISVSPRNSPLSLHSFRSI